MDKPQKIKVLYIDDEVNNLHGFKASFRFDYTVLTANSTAEAHKLLSTHPDISVILCDQRMPDQTGVEFFEQILEAFPKPVRMLITGYTDIESVINAINRGHIFRYIKKPWVESDVRSAIEEGHKYYVTTSLLAAKNQALEKAYTELDKFSYSVTHDLRGPILSVLGIIGFAKQTQDRNEVNDMLELVEKAMLKLNNFIDNTHDYFKLNRGEMQIQEINFRELADTMRDIYQPNSLVQGIDFDIRVQQEEPFRSDAVSIQIVLNNLLSNAFKYQRKSNDHKQVSLDITVEKGLATITVSDNGIGIEQAYISKIFNMFYRATSEEFGTGFGLYNVQDALSKINGEVSVSSEPGLGSIFTVTIPGK